MLARENHRRDSSSHDEAYDDVFVTHVNADGTTQEKKVDKVSILRCKCHSSLTLDILKAFLDLTDLQNKDFRFIL